MFVFRLKVTRGCDSMHWLGAKEARVIMRPECHLTYQAHQRLVQGRGIPELEGLARAGVSIQPIVTNRVLLNKNPTTYISYDARVGSGRGRVTYLLPCSILVMTSLTSLTSLST